MSHILVLGAGFVAGPLVDYLVRKNHQITVASQLIEEAQAIAEQYPQIKINQLDVSDDDALGSLVAEHDLIISFVPLQFHVKVARQCIKFAKHMVTASYENVEMKALDQQAVDSNITILNEIGLDPGIDHLSAMEVIDSIHQKGGKLTSFVSWCGGLPAVDSNNNPLGYKFAWAPKSVLLALLNEATFLKDGKVITVPAEQLLENVQAINVSDELQLEGYPNRDSISYRDIYGIQDAQQVLRGTLRYQGFSEILHCCKQLGLLDTNAGLEQKDTSSWLTLFNSVIPDLDGFLSEQSEAVIDGLKWLGLLNPEARVPKASSMIDAFCSLLMDKLAYADEERDMVVLQHKFESVTAQGVREQRQSTLILEGEVNGFSAMAKTVGTPAAIAADLILSGEIKQRGVILPMKQEVYKPLLQALDKEGITMDETFNIV